MSSFLDRWRLDRALDERPAAERTADFGGEPTPRGTSLRLEARVQADPELARRRAELERVDELLREGVARERRVPHGMSARVMEQVEVEPFAPYRPARHPVVGALVRVAAAAAVVVALFWFVERAGLPPQRNLTAMVMNAISAGPPLDLRQSVDEPLQDEGRRLARDAGSAGRKLLGRLPPPFRDRALLVWR